MANSEIVKELMKDRLRNHLIEIEKLVVNWRPQLSAPRPFSSEPSDLSVVPYRPQLERDSDNAHMLRKHIKSRAFWKLHTAWEINLSHVSSSVEPVVRQGREFVAKLATKSPDLKFTRFFAWTAAEEAFLQISNMRSARDYRPNSKQGLNFGSCVIEEKAASAIYLTTVEAEHKELVKKLSERPEWEEICAYWLEAKKAEDGLAKIVDSVMKSSDIFHPCRFCRKLFKA